MIIPIARIKLKRTNIFMDKPNKYRPKNDAIKLTGRAMAGTITVAEVEELVPVGELDPNQIHTPGIFVQRILQGENYEKRIEQRTVRKRE